MQRRFSFSSKCATKLDLCSHWNQNKAKQTGSVDSLFWKSVKRCFSHCFCSLLCFGGSVAGLGLKRRRFEGLCPERKHKAWHSSWGQRKLRSCCDNWDRCLLPEMSERTQRSILVSVQSGWVNYLRRKEHIWRFLSLRPWRHHFVKAE